MAADLPPPSLDFLSKKWADFSGPYEAEMGQWSQPLAAMLASQLRISHASAVLEVACGQCRTALESKH